MIPPFIKRKEITLPSSTGGPFIFLPKSIFKWFHGQTISRFMVCGVILKGVKKVQQHLYLYRASFNKLSLIMRKTKLRELSKIVTNKNTNYNF